MIKVSAFSTIIMSIEVLAVTPSSFKESLVSTQKRLEESEKHLDHAAKMFSIRKH